MGRDLTPTVDREAMLGLFDEAPLYDETAVRELFVSVGPPPDAAAKAEAAAFRLSELGKSFAFALYGQSTPSVVERERQARQLAKACESVLRLTGVHEGGDLLPMFAQGGLFAAASIRGEPSGKAATMNALRAVDLLRQDALKLVEIEGKRRGMSPPRPGRPEDVATQRLVRDLSCFYETVWQREPGTSTGEEGEAAGPLVRVMVAVAERLRARGLQFYFSAEWLAQVWKRLPGEEKMPGTHIARQLRDKS